MRMLFNTIYMTHAPNFQSCMQSALKKCGKSSA